MMTLDNIVIIKTCNVLHRYHTHIGNLELLQVYINNNFTIV